MGFQINSTITTPLWLFQADPNDPTQKTICINLAEAQYIETNTAHNKVWIYFPSTNTAVTQHQLVLEGDAARQFMTDLIALF